jgi:hypothetical protein
MEYASLPPDKYKYRCMDCEWEVKAYTEDEFREKTGQEIYVYE